MTVTTSAARIPYTTTTGQTVITVPFKVQRTADLLVYRTPSGGSASLLTYGTHYTIAGLFETTCALTLLTPAVAGDTYLLLRVASILQELNLRNQGRYFPQTTEEQLDRIVMMILQLDVLLSSTTPSAARALLLGVNDVVGSGAYDALSNRIKNMDDPTADQDGATKKYVDTAVGGIVSGGGGAFVSAIVTAAALPSPSVTYEKLAYLVRDAGLPDILKVCLRQSNGTTYEWVAFANASA